MLEKINYKFRLKNKRVKLESRPNSSPAHSTVAQRSKISAQPNTAKQKRERRSDLPRLTSFSLLFGPQAQLLDR